MALEALTDVMAALLLTIAWRAQNGCQHLKARQDNMITSQEKSSLLKVNQMTVQDPR